MSKPYSEETKELILQMHEYGLSGRAIARSLGLGKTAVNDFLASQQEQEEQGWPVGCGMLGDEEDFSFINQEIYPLDWKKRVHPEGLIAGGGLADKIDLDELIFGVGKDAANEAFSIPVGRPGSFPAGDGFAGIPIYDDFLYKNSLDFMSPMTSTSAFSPYNPVDGESVARMLDEIKRGIESVNKPDGKTHLYIPDNQVKPGIDMSYLTWIGEYIVRKQPDVIICGGDFADMPSLSSYDKGTRRAEGKNVQDDIDAAIKGMERLLAPLHELQAEQRDLGVPVYSPRMVLTLGNHEDRIDRHVNANPELHKFLSIDSLRYKDFGWEVVPFLTPIVCDGISYCHYFINNMTGKPLGGSALNILKTVGTSFTQGHRQTLDVAVRFLPSDGRQQWGMVAGAAYTHEEEYKGNQGNHHWRGIILKHNVKDGAYDPLFVSLDWLEKEYG